MHIGRHKDIYIHPYRLWRGWELLLSYLGEENEVSTASKTEITCRKPDKFMRGDRLKPLTPDLPVLCSPSPISPGSKRLGLH